MTDIMYVVLEALRLADEWNYPIEWHPFYSPPQAWENNIVTEDLLVDNAVQALPLPDRWNYPIEWHPSNSPPQEWETNIVTEETPVEDAVETCHIELEPYEREGPFPLMLLPAEIRDMVYDFVGHNHSGCDFPLDILMASKDTLHDAMPWVMRPLYLVFRTKISEDGAHSMHPEETFLEHESGETVQPVGKLDTEPLQFVRQFKVDLCQEGYSWQVARLEMSIDRKRPVFSIEVDNCYKPERDRDIFEGILRAETEAWTSLPLGQYPSLEEFRCCAERINTGLFRTDEYPPDEWW